MHVVKNLLHVGVDISWLRLLVIWLRFHPIFYWFLYFIFLSITFNFGNYIGDRREIYSSGEFEAWWNSEAIVHIQGGCFEVETILWHGRVNWMTLFAFALHVGSVVVKDGPTKEVQGVSKASNFPTEFAPLISNYESFFVVFTPINRRRQVNMLARLHSFVCRKQLRTQKSRTYILWP